MKTKQGLTKMLFALLTAVGVAACGADNKDKKDEESKKASATDPKPVIEMKTSMGSFKVELNREKSPITVNNFLKYVEKKHFDGTIFHRVMANFMIQGGGFEKGPAEKKKTTMDPIKNEAKTNGLHNDAYTISMARTSDPNSATAQFFISVANNRQSLDPNPRSAGYAAFGKVIEGKEVVDKIKGVKVVANPMNPREISKPAEQIILESVRVVEKKKEEKKTDEKKKEKKAEKE